MTFSRQLAIAFGILPTTKPPLYSELLLNMARATPHFIINLENKLNAFIKSPESKLKLPSMDAVQRKTVQELAKYYYLDVDILGVDPSKHVQLTKKTGSRTPTALLSQMAAYEDESVFPLQQQHHIQPHLKVVDKPSSTLHIYDLSAKVRNQHLENFLKPYEGNYVIQWIDDLNALAIFKDEPMMRKALQSLGNGLFKVKAYQDSNTEFDGDGFMGGKVSETQFKATKGPGEDNPDYRMVTKPVKPKCPTPPKPKPENRTINLFSALSDEKHTLNLGNVKDNWEELSE